MDINRRNFLKKSGSVLKSGLFLYMAELIIPRIVSTSTGVEYNWEKHLYGFVVDTHVCIGCGRCVNACKKEHKVPDRFYPNWVER